MRPFVVSEARQLKRHSEDLERAAIKAMAEVDQMYAERSDCLDRLQALCQTYPELAAVLAAIE